MGFITIEGENQIAAKQGGGLTLNIANFVLANIAGLGVEPADRIEAMPIVGDIVDTLPVTMAGYVNTNQVVYSLTMDSSIGDYDFNWIGLVDDEGKLIAVTYTPLIKKRATAGAVPGNNLTRNFLIAYSGIQATVAIAVPAATWQIDFNARLQGIDERERLANFDLYGHDGFIGDAYSIVRQAATTTYDVSVGVGYVGGIRIDNAALQQVIAAALDSVWIDVSLQGDISDVSPVVDFIIDAAAHVDYTDGNGFEHYLVKLCDIAADGSVVDVRTTGTAHEKEADPHQQYLPRDESETLPSITASVALNDLTVGLNSGTLSFRNSDLTIGIRNSLSFLDLSLVVPNGATLGTLDTIESRLILIALNDAGTIKLALVNEAGGNSFNEEGLISTVAIDATADLDNVIYSDAAYVDVPYRVVGVFESTQAIAGTWVTAPTLLQSAGGNALASMNSLGYGQTWQAVTRTNAVTYYNTTGRPIMLSIYSQTSAGTYAIATVVINGVSVTIAAGSNGSADNRVSGSIIIPAGASYLINYSMGADGAWELR